MATIAECLQQAKILTDSDSPRLDVELLLAHVLQCDRGYFYTWPEKTLTVGQLQSFQQLLERRQQGEPIAYILGEKEFWSLALGVNKATLIPRPETEMLVELSLELANKNKAQRVLDLGTGTGAIALALAAEKPQWQIFAVDNEIQSVALAESNRIRHQLENVKILASNWFSQLSDQRFDLIVSNPPYIAQDDPHLTMGDVRFEPGHALVADCHGLEALTTIIAQAPAYLNRGGWLLVEHGALQGAAVRELFFNHGYENIATHRDLAEIERVTLGQIIIEEPL